MNFQDCVEILRNLSLALSAPTAAFIAWKGLESWKYEKKWQKDVELSEDLLVLMYQRRDAIRDIRQPYVSFRPATHDESGKEIVDQEHAQFKGQVDYFQSRVNKLDQIRSEIYAKRLRATVIWGEKLNELLEQVFALEQKLILNLRRHIRSLNPHLSHAQREAAAKHEETLEVIFGDGDEEDVFYSKYEKHFALVEDYLRQKLKEAA
ncbi:hypothetical protein KUW17_11160 [Leisingera aquaemixtae]|uniref:hypothetical protein n=1 Tax=Leisingera aquaemixtae TaxID=1396826 RepID=UPI001C93F0DA|nr:hypothetical protein [Leisingera aquaemixtae]MBY6067300.1 hypothetical protein [Leisingera aquaemixtae]